MKLFRTWMIGVAALLAPHMAPAQTAAPRPAPAPAPAATPATAAKPALWVIHDHDTTIYLFGTIHVLKPGIGWFDRAVKQAFDRSGTLILELVLPENPASIQGVVVAKGMTKDGPTLPEQLPADHRALYAKALADLGLPAAAFDRARPWFAATNLSLLPLMRAGYDPAQGPESVLTKAAKAAGKPVEGLETFEQQIGYLSGLSQPAQVAFLDQTLDELPKAQTQIGGMVAAWTKGDPETIGRELNKGIDKQPELAKTLLFDRNERWATAIKARLAKPGTVFIAVGAGHLAGNRSVLADLKKLGVEARRVVY